MSSITVLSWVFFSSSNQDSSNHCFFQQLSTQVLSQPCRLQYVLGAFHNARRLSPVLNFLKIFTSQVLSHFLEGTSSHHNTGMLTTSATDFCQQVQPPFVCHYGPKPLTRTRNKWQKKTEQQEKYTLQKMFPQDKVAEPYWLRVLAAWGSWAESQFHLLGQPPLAEIMQKHLTHTKKHSHKLYTTWITFIHTYVVFQEGISESNIKISQRSSFKQNVYLIFPAVT